MESLKAFINEMNNIKDMIIDYIDDDAPFPKFDMLDSVDYNYPRKLILIEIFHLIENIANNHFRRPSFFVKIERLIHYFEKELNTNFSPNEIFKIFGSNKRILLFLIQEKILNVNNYICAEIEKNPDYNLYLKKPAKKDEIYEEKRKLGENDNYICQLIQKDLIDDFIIFTNKTNIPLNSKIPSSLFETNQFLIVNSPTFIEYAAFYGSMQIIKYMVMNGINMKPSIWLYAIHSNNPELIHYIEEKGVEPPDYSYLECLAESIKCFWTNITEYIKNNLITEEIDKYELYEQTIQYHNYAIPFEYSNENLLDYIKYDYPVFVYNYMNGIIGLKHKLNDFLNNKEMNESKDEKDTLYSKEETPLLVAVENGNKEIVNLLASNRNIDINQILKTIEKTRTFLSVAVESGNKDIVEVLLNNIDINVNIKLTNVTDILNMDDEDLGNILEPYLREIKEKDYYIEHFVFCENRYDFEISILFIFITFLILYFTNQISKFC